MPTFEGFMKANKKTKPNVFYPATKSLCDGEGKPLLWELRAVSTKEADKLREACTTEVPIKGKPGLFRQRVDSGAYTVKLMCAAVVMPNLNDTALQNSYGVMSAEELLKEMLDDAGEYLEFSQFVQTLCGFTTLMEDVEEAKN